MAECFPKVTLPDGFDDRWEAEIADRGYFSEARVVAQEGCQYHVFFVDPIRLGQELRDTTVKLGRPWFAEPGLIILTEVTVDAMQEAVEALWREGFFAHLRPLEPTHL